MKILYIEAHETLAYDQINMWTELGHEVCSTGFYRNPLEPKTILRGPTKNKVNESWISVFEQLNPNYILPSMHPSSGMCTLPLWLVNQFDAVVLDYYPWMLEANWDAFYSMNAKLIIRTLGFGNEMVESFYAAAKRAKPDIKIVRLSEREKLCQNYCGHDAIIPQGYNPNDYFEWNGQKENVLTINKMFKKRAESCGYDIYMQVTEPFKKERVLLGNENEDIEFAQHVPFNTLKQYLANSRVYLSTMSRPASCITYGFIEAWCQGIPIVSFGNGIGNSGGQESFMIDKFIEHGVNGFYSDNIFELQLYIRSLLDDYDLAKQIGQEGRKKGLSIFHQDIIKNQWKDILNGH